LAVASLVLGILGIVLCWFPASLFGVPLGIVGLILGIVGRKNAGQTGMPTGLPTAGLVLSVIGVILSVASLVACMACMTAVNREIANNPQLREQYERQNQGFGEASKKLQEPHPVGMGATASGATVAPGADTATPPTAPSGKSPAAAPAAPAKPR
jgi:hypothetical protein